MKKTSLRDIDKFFNGKKRKLALIGGALILVGAIATSEPIPESEHIDKLNAEILELKEDYKELENEYNESLVAQEEIEKYEEVAPTEEISSLKVAESFAKDAVEVMTKTGGASYVGYEIIGKTIIIQYNIGLYEIVEKGYITSIFTIEQWEEIRNTAEGMGKGYFDIMEKYGVKGYDLELRCGNYSEDVKGLDKRTVLTVRNGEIVYDAVVEQFN